MRTFELLQRLSQAVGISGYEDEVRAIVVAELSKLCDEVKIGSLDSVVARKAGTQNQEPRRCVMLAAHLDEIGLMVTDIEKSFLRFTNVGGIDARVLPGQEVVVYGKSPLRGIICARPPHVLTAEEREKAPKLAQLFVDVDAGGRSVDSEAELRELVSVGDLIGFYRETLRLGEGAAAGKSFDNRASVTVLLLVAELLSKVKHNWDVYLVATAQEEVGLRGAMTNTFAITPDVGVAIDVGFGDMPGLPAGETLSMGKGPALTIGPNIHPALFNQLVEAARDDEIPYQVLAEPGDTGTDAWAMQVTGAGIPTALVGIPLRYMHTTVETVVLADIERAARLIAAFVGRLDEATLEKLGYPLELEAKVD